MIMRAINIKTQVKSVVINWGGDHMQSFMELVKSKLESCSEPKEKKKTFNYESKVEEFDEIN